MLFNHQDFEQDTLDLMPDDFKGHPDYPDHPSHPDHPDHPSHPDHPDHPSHPDHPDHPGHPDHPDHPSNPDHPDPERPITVIVNGEDKLLPVGTRELSYREVVVLAYGTYNDASNIIYTVVYSNGPIENPKGSLVKGRKVRVREGMIFNVGCSDKS